MIKKSYKHWAEIEADYPIYTGYVDSASVTDGTIGREDNGVLFIACSVLDDDHEHGGYAIIDMTSKDEIPVYIFEVDEDDEARAFARQIIEPWKHLPDFGTTFFFMEDEDVE